MILATQSPVSSPVNSTMGEQNLRKGFDLRSSRTIEPQVEPMEVGHFRPSIRCYKCNKMGHAAKNCKTKVVHAVYQKKSYTYSSQDCWKGDRKGHYKRLLYTKGNELEEQENKGALFQLKPLKRKLTIFTSI